jgi:hypothetical protein
MVFLTPIDVFAKATMAGTLQNLFYLSFDKSMGWNQMLSQEQKHMVEQVAVQEATARFVALEESHNKNAFLRFTNSTVVMSSVFLN